MRRQGVTRTAWLVMGGVVLSSWLLLASGADAPASVALAAQQASIVQDATASAPVIHYQGRLLDPTTSQPKPDGSYQMSFNLYTVNSGGAPLWSETKSVTVNRGLFSVLLGESTPLNLAHFNGQELWLGVTVGADPEAQPRQRIAHVAYSLYAENTGQAASAESAASAANADALDGLDSTAFALAAHTHTGADIVDNSITSDDIADATRNLGFPANALNFDGTSTIITQFGSGLRWQANFANGAYLMLPRPLDWDGTSDVTLQLYFAAVASGSGNVDFFIRPRAFDPGDNFADASSFDGAAVSLTQANQIGRQTFTIPAARFGAKSLWVITLQRGGSEETYTGDVILFAVDLRYTAVR
jgi:hypothetical protein